MKKQTCGLKNEVHNLKILNEELKNTKSVDVSQDVVGNLKQELLNLKRSLESNETCNMENSPEEYEKKISDLNNQIEKMQGSAEDYKKEEVVMQEKVKDLEEQLEASEKLMEDLVDDYDKDKKIMESKLEKKSSELKQVQDERESSKSNESNLLNELKELKSSYQRLLDEKDKLILERQELNAKMSSEEKASEKDLSINTNLENDLSKKITYIKELEDIILEKEFRISELEKSSVQTDGKNHIADVKDVEDKINGLERKLKESLNNEKELKIQVETLTAKAAENTEVMAHQEKMKRQRDDLEKRVAECEKASNQLSEVED